MAHDREWAGEWQYGPAMRKRKRVMVAVKIVLGLAVLGVGIGCISGILFAEAFLRMCKPGSESYTLPRGCRAVTFDAPDGVRLAGWWAPAESAKGTIIVCHGFGADKENAFPYAQLLRNGGFSSLILDMRGHGESQGRTGSLGYLETEDIKVVLDWLEKTPEAAGKPVGIFGCSMGGTVAILAAAADDRISAVAAEAPFADPERMATEWVQKHAPIPRWPVVWTALRWMEWRLGCKYEEVRAVDFIPDIAPRPLFLIYGEVDPLVGPENSRRLFDAAGLPKELWVVPGAGHVDCWDVAGTEYERKLLGFFEEALSGD